MKKKLFFLGPPSESRRAALQQTPPEVPEGLAKPPKSPEKSPAPGSSPDPVLKAALDKARTKRGLSPIYGAPSKEISGQGQEKEQLKAALDVARKRCKAGKWKEAAAKPELSKAEMKEGLKRLFRAAGAAPSYKPDGKPSFDRSRIKPAKPGAPYKKQFSGGASRPGNKELALRETGRLKRLSRLGVTFVSNSRAEKLIEILGQNTALADRSKAGMEFLDGLKIKKACSGTCPIAINELKELFKTLKLNRSQRTEVLRLYLRAAIQASEKVKFEKIMATYENYHSVARRANGWSRQRNHKRSYGFILKIIKAMKKLNWIVFQKFTAEQYKTRKIYFSALNRWSSLDPAKAVRLKNKMQGRAPPDLIAWI